MVARQVAVITGANSNLGLNIAYRLLEVVPEDARLTIVVTSRTLPRVNEVISQIQEYSKKVTRSGILDFDYVLLDFGDLISVMNAYYELDRRYKHIDYVFFNSAQSVYSGIDWLGATKEILTNPIQGVTYPQYKIQRVGVKSKDGLGLVFQGNVFGPYYFVHKIKHLLKNGGRIIWISSLMSDPKYLSFDDLELLKTPSPYDGSKRLIDLLHLATYESLKKEGITSYLTHPGIFISLGFSKYLNFVSWYGMILLFYVARLLGSPWHNITGYNASTAIIQCLKYEPQQEKQNVKYGSALTTERGCHVEVSSIDSTGAEDVLKYIDELVLRFDEEFKGQIKNTRQLL